MLENNNDILEFLLQKKKERLDSICNSSTQKGKLSRSGHIGEEKEWKRKYIYIYYTNIKF